MAKNNFSITDYLRTKGWRHISIILFFVMVGVVVGGIYFATQKVEYVWRLYRVTQYFYYKDTVETRADVEGEVVGLAAVCRDLADDTLELLDLPTADHDLGAEARQLVGGTAADAAAAARHEDDLP